MCNSKSHEPPSTVDIIVDRRVMSRMDVRNYTVLRRHIYTHDTILQQAIAHVPVHRLLSHQRVGLVQIEVPSQSRDASPERRRRRGSLLWVSGIHANKKPLLEQLAVLARTHRIDSKLTASIY